MLATSKKSLSEPIAVFIGAILVLVSVGCDDPSASNRKRPVLGNEQSARETSNERMMASGRDGDMDLVRLVEVPTREGLRLQYRSDILAFNLLGYATLSPFTPQQVWEYQIGESLRAVAVLDELTGDAIVVIYDGCAIGKQTFSLDGEDGGAQGWILRGQSPESVKEGEVQQFLSGPQESSRAFGLNGRVTIDLKDGYVQRMSFANVATREDVPAVDARLHSKVEFWKHQRDQLTEQLKVNPDDELLAWGVKQAEDNLRSFQRLVETKPKAPARLTNGQVAAEWVRRKPLFRIELP